MGSKTNSISIVITLLIFIFLATVTAAVFTPLAATLFAVAAIFILILIIIPILFREETRGKREFSEAASRRGALTEVSSETRVARVNVRKVKNRGRVVTSKSLEISLELIRGCYNLSLKNLIINYGCVKGSKIKVVNLTKEVAPEGYEGSWECCLLGCGGWGCAYLCRGLADGEEVVFKVPRGLETLFEEGSVPTVDERLLSKIRTEAQLLRSLKHPNILKLLSYSFRFPLLVYEFANYGSLEWQLAHGWRPDLRDVVLVGIQVGDALRYIHSRGLVHVDIKPSNVFIKDGVAKVGDFSGIVKLLSLTSSQSRFTYTPGWRAPEQVFSDLRRKVRDLGIENRIDTYQLGNLLLYLITGNVLDGEDAVGGDGVERATEAVSDSGLREVIRKALNPDPLRRPSTEYIIMDLLKIWVKRFK